MKTIEEACYWFSTLPVGDAEPPLQGAVEAEIAIVGAGFTGLWSAWFLKQLEPKLEIAIVEQGVAGYGASGRNAGIVSPCLDHSHALAVAHFGRDEAIRLANLGLQNIVELAAFAQDCDFQPSGVLNVALNEEQLSACEETAQVAAGLGIGGHHVLNQEQARNQLNSPLYVGALLIDHGGIINPFKLISKLKRELKAQPGVKIFERTKITKVSNQTLTAANGSLTAKRIIMATDAYTHHLFPELLSRFIPLYDYILVSDRLTDEQLQAIGWKKRQGVTDGRTFFNYYRLTADNRILWGTSEAAYYAPNRVDEDCDHSQKHYDALRASFARHFPQLAGLDFPFAWGGPIASTTRLTPFFGSLNNGGIVYGLGYTGHGIGTTRIAGNILAHMALSLPHELLQLKMVSKQPFPYPPEPIRGMAVNAVTESLRRVDAGHKPNVLLKMLDALGIGFSS